jgi:hypothetical protein
MRTRSIVIGVAVVLLLILSLIVMRQSQPADSGEASVRKVSAPGAPEPVPTSSTDVSAESPPPTSETPSARGALARGVARFSMHRIDMWAHQLEAMHGGASAEFRRFARDFLAAAGDDAILLAKLLLDECASEEARFLLAAVLGETRDPEAIPILKDLIAKSPGPQATAAALYSIGMTGTREGMDYLTAWLASSREAKSKDLAYLLSPALAAIGRHGADALDFMIKEARARGDEQFPSRSEVLAMIRGQDAGVRLRGLLSDASAPDLHVGAAQALGHSASPEDLEWVSRTPLAYHALVAGRDLPDLWDRTGAHRREIAERLLLSGSPNWMLAQLVAPDKSRAVYQTVVAATDQGSDPRSRLISIVAAFADQPDLDVHVARLASEAQLLPQDLERAIQLGLDKGFLPGRDVGSAPLVARMLSVVRDPGSNWSVVQLAMPPVMKSGIAESTLSSTLVESWRGMAIGPRNSMLAGVTHGARGMGVTQPEGFLTTVLKEESDAALRLRAAYAYFVAGDPVNPDPEILRAIALIVEGRDTGWTSPVEVPYTLPPLMGNWYARFGTRDDIPKLLSLPDLYTGPPNIGDGRHNLRINLTREMTRAIDAIRLRHAGK